MIDIKTDAKEVWDMFYSFETKEMKKALTTGLRNAASQLRKGVRKELKNKIPSSTKKNPKYNDSLSQGVRITKVKEREGYFYTYITIASNRKTGSGSFRLHILEGGTNPRYTKKGYYRGQIKPYNFFTAALSTFRPQQDRILQQEIDKAVVKINKKKFK